MGCMESFIFMTHCTPISCFHLKVLTCSNLKLNIIFKSVTNNSVPSQKLPLCRDPLPYHPLPSTAVLPPMTESMQCCLWQTLFYNECMDEVMTLELPLTKFVFYQYYLRLVGSYFAKCMCCKFSRLFRTLSLKA